MQIQQVMTANPTCAQAGDSLQTAATHMASEGIGSLPVVDNGQIVGVVADRDIAIRGVAQGAAASARVDSVMSQGAVCVTPDTNVSEAAKIMQEKQIRRLYVTDGSNVVGVVSLGDIALEANPEKTGEVLKEISKS